MARFSTTQSPTSSLSTLARAASSRLPSATRGTSTQMGTSPPPRLCLTPSSARWAPRRRLTSWCRTRAMLTSEANWLSAFRWIPRTSRTRPTSASRIRTRRWTICAMGARTTRTSCRGASLPAAPKPRRARRRAAARGGQAAVGPTAQRSVAARRERAAARGACGSRASPATWWQCSRRWSPARWTWMRSSKSRSLSRRMSI
mmetsp:Transcript_136907/g.425355  ORF Transcript_136907/g.425355 Transcript_136907/m.425355 type:complete len:202 (+) Transcript_136907:67-672(+)